MAGPIHRIRKETEGEANCRRCFPGGKWPPIAFIKIVEQKLIYALINEVLLLFFNSTENTLSSSSVVASRKTTLKEAGSNLVVSFEFSQ